MNNLYKKTVKAGEQAVNDDGRWLIAESGIVADNNDPERQHRVKVVIPSIDEDVVYDDWARQMVFCMGNGYGSVFIPPIGAEVLLFGGLGQKFNLFYAGLYNDETQVPPDFEDSTVCGFRVPGDFKMIADLDMQLRAGRMSIEVDSQLNVIVPGGMFINGQRIG